jgi:hypothetical protein
VVYCDYENLREVRRLETERWCRQAVLCQRIGLEELPPWELALTARLFARLLALVHRHGRSTPAPGVVAAEQ